MHHIPTNHQPTIALRSAWGGLFTNVTICHVSCTYLGVCGVVGAKGITGTCQGERAHMAATMEASFTGHSSGTNSPLQISHRNMTPSPASHATPILQSCDELSTRWPIQFRQGKRRMKRAIAVVLAVVVAVDAQRPAPNRPTPALIQAGTNTTTAPTDDVRRPTNMPSLSPMTPFPTEAQPTYEPVSRIEFAGRQLRSKPVDRPRDWRQTTN